MKQLKPRRQQHRFVSNILLNKEETIIATDKGAIVMIDKKNWDEIIETLWLLKDKKSLKALTEGHRTRAEKKTPKGKTLKEVFYDL
jgi:hypothetical protein